MNEELNKAWEELARTLGSDKSAKARNAVITYREKIEALTQEATSQHTHDKVCFDCNMLYELGFHDGEDYCLESR